MSSASDKLRRRLDPRPEETAGKRLLVKMSTSAQILRRPPIVLLDDARADPGAPASRLYREPVEVICARSLEEVIPALARADAALAQNLHLAGWVAFEAAAAFEPRIARALTALPAEPLVWLGVFEAPQLLSSHDTEALIEAAMGGTARRGEITDCRFSVKERAYKRTFARIAEAIAAGEVYQLNYTFPAELEAAGDLLALYRRLRAAQPVSFGAYIDTGETQALSLSPEQFLRSRDGGLETRPMKGTAARGRTLTEDRRAADSLRADPKSQAENLMIVDLLRNDLSRVAEPGSVAVPELFNVETYPTVLQMTSRVTARRAADARFSDLLRALFPCGSVTGAPKLRAIELIGELETHPRGIYTGAIGWADPDGDLCLSVPIRTVIAQAGAGLRMGIGSGIVADSRADAEYAECRLKARFLASEPAVPALIETMGWTPGEGYRYLERHLDRLEASAAYFGYRCARDEIFDRLSVFAKRLDRPMTVRLLLDRQGEPALTARPHAPWPEPVRLALCPLSVDPDDMLLRHKTTRRGHYEGPLAALHAAGEADEAVFVTSDGRVTEGARCTVFVERAGRLLTPPLSAGILPGVLRQVLIERGEAHEAELTRRDLLAVDVVFVGNAARGLARARLISGTEALTSIKAPDHDGGDSSVTRRNEGYPSCSNPI